MSFLAWIVLGLIAGFVCYFMVAKVKARFGYDDTLDAFGVHGAGGTIGALLTGQSLALGLALLVSGTVSGDWATEPVRLVVGVLVAAAVALGAAPRAHGPPRPPTGCRRRTPPHRPRSGGHRQARRLRRAPRREAVRCWR